jgi:hypothetical protein
VSQGETNGGRLSPANERQPVRTGAACLFLRSISVHSLKGYKSAFGRLGHAYGTGGARKLRKNHPYSEKDGLATTRGSVDAQRVFLTRSTHQLRWPPRGPRFERAPRVHRLEPDSFAGSSGYVLIYRIIGSHYVRLDRRRELSPAFRPARMCHAASTVILAEHDRVPVHVRDIVSNPRSGIAAFSSSLAFIDGLSKQPWTCRSG